MGFFDFFKKKKKVKKKVYAPGTKIQYHSGLIPKLEADHKVLLETFVKISNANEKGNYTLVDKSLREFKQLVNNHFLLEDLKLYIYLKHVLNKDEENLMLLKNFKTEISAIGSVVSKFINEYTDIQWTDIQIQCFGKELAGIGAALIKRIKSEEDILYPLYLPPNDY